MSASLGAAARGADTKDMQTTCHQMQARACLSPRRDVVFPSGAAAATVTAAGDTATSETAAASSSSIKGTVVVKCTFGLKKVQRCETLAAGGILNKSYRLEVE